MNKRFKYLIRVVVVVLVGYVIYFISDYMIFGHSTDLKKWKEYIYLFNDSIIQDVDTILAYSDVTRNDVYTNFHYIPNDSGRSVEEKFFYNPKDTAYNVVFWEFKKLSNVSVNNVVFRTNKNLDHLKLERGEILNSKSDQRVSIHYGFEYQNININIDNHSKIEKFINGKNYKGFIGSINRMSFSNENEEHEIFIDYLPGQKQVLFLVYKNKNQFFIIIIRSDKQFKENLINILHLQ